MLAQVPARAARSRISIGLRWRRLDMLGHLNQAVYHELLEEGRGALLTSLGDVASFPFVLVRVELDYRAEVRHDHEHGRDRRARASGWAPRASRWRTRSPLPDGTVAARAAPVIVAWDPQRGARVSSPTPERAALTG